jgi:hypothetical protein
MTGKIALHTENAMPTLTSYQNCGIKPYIVGPRTYTQRIAAGVAWYIWKGAVFEVPITTLEGLKAMGGWEMTNMEAKCRELLLYLMYIHG